MRPARKGRIGTIMVTPPKLPANDSLPPLMRTLVMSSGPLAFGLVVALSLPTTMRSGTAPPEAAKETAKPELVLTAENAVELCQQLFEEPKEHIDDTARRRRWDLRRESCKMAFDADPANAERKVAYARNLPYEQKAEAVVMLREAAAQGSAEAYYQLYEHHRSWDRGDLDKAPLGLQRPHAGRAAARRISANAGQPSQDHAL